MPINQEGKETCIPINHEGHSTFSLTENLPDFQAGNWEWNEQFEGSASCSRWLSQKEGPNFEGKNPNINPFTIMLVG